VPDFGPMSDYTPRMVVKAIGVGLLVLVIAGAVVVAFGAVGMYMLIGMLGPDW
jgi:hypothetical protein